MQYRLSKSKALGKYYYCYIFRRINGTLKDAARQYNIFSFSFPREKDGLRKEKQKRNNKLGH